MAENVARLQEIERDLRSDQKAAERRMNEETDRGTEPREYHRGRAEAYKIAADRIVGEIQEILYA